MPFIHGTSAGEWRDYVISEYDYSITPMSARLGVSPKDARLFMMRDERWKMMHAEGGFPPMLFDMQKDPNEMVDLGRDPAYEATRRACYKKLADWGLRCSQRTTISDAELEARRGRSRRRGIVLGTALPDEADAELFQKYLGSPGSAISDVTAGLRLTLRRPGATLLQAGRCCMSVPEIRFDDGAAYDRMMGVWTQFVGSRFLEWLEPAKGKRWLDVGCGTGAFTQQIIDISMPVAVDGVDPSAAQIDFASKRPGASLARFRTGDAMVLPYDDNAFDVAVMAS